MQIKAWPSELFLVAFLFAVVGCQKYVTQPIYRRPVISSVVAFPTVLGPGDSTIITVFATDPDGDSLVYDWDAYNGLIIKDARPGSPTSLYNTRSPARVFYRSTTWPHLTDTAFVWCSARDQRGGSASRQVLIAYRH
jgi:hypothetical protein